MGTRSAATLLEGGINGHNTKKNVSGFACKTFNANL